MNLYFQNHLVRETEQFRAPIESLYGQAKKWWYQFRADRTSNPTWKELRKAMRKKFGVPQTSTDSNGKKFPQVFLNVYNSKPPSSFNTNMSSSIQCFRCLERGHVASICPNPHAKKLLAMELASEEVKEGRMN